VIVVTGGAGFICSNLVKALNERGRDDILVVDDLGVVADSANLVGRKVLGFRDKDDLLTFVSSGQEFQAPVEAVIHLGACSSTTEPDRQFMMENNYEYSKILLHYCLDREIPFIHASSASVYGNGREFDAKRAIEAPLNVYGHSKLLFDRDLREVQDSASSQVVSLRYFNVYGPREQHKDSMASVAYQFNRQILDNGRVKLFEGCDGFADGEQRRDFIYVVDVVDVTLWFMDNPKLSGIFNVGTGQSETFNNLARAVIDWHGFGQVEYIPFPEPLKGSYQSFTEANIDDLREAGYEATFLTVQEGVPLYLNWLNRDRWSSG